MPAPEELQTFRFAKPGWEDVEIVCRVAPIGVGELFALTEALDRKGVDAFREAVTMFDGLALVSWNLERPAGTPVPPSLLNVNPKWARSLIDGWISEVIDLPGPLAGTSLSGEPSTEESTQPPESP